MIIVGIDPGTATTGWGIIKVNEKDQNIRCVNYGVIKTSPKLPSPKRLNIIYNQLSKIIEKYNPKIIAVEKVYFFKNLKTAMPVAEAKGVISLLAAKKNIPLQEFTPLQVKMAIIGYGRAEKIQIQKMIKNLLNLKELPKPDDAADAIAIALCAARL